MGQAVGTAASLCLKKDVLPRELAQKHMDELQEQLLRDDAFIPSRPANDAKDLAKTADLIFASSTISGDAKLLVDGVSRDINDEVHHWESDGLPAEIGIVWERPVALSSVEIKCDTNLKRNIMMRKDHMENDTFGTSVPPEMLKSLEIQARINGQWVRLGSTDDNRTRLTKFQFDQIKTPEIRVQLKETYGYRNAKLFEIRCYEA